MYVAESKRHTHQGAKKITTTASTWPNCDLGPREGESS
jgi:hypothetical protein